MSDIHVGDVGTRLTVTLTDETGVYALTGGSVGLRAQRLLTGGAGASALTGQSIGLRADRRLSAVAGAYALAPGVGALRVARRMTGVNGAYALTGQPSDLRADRRLAVAPGVTVLTGWPVLLFGGGPQYHEAADFSARLCLRLELATGLRRNHAAEANLTFDMAQAAVVRHAVTDVATMRRNVAFVLELE